MRVLTLFYLIFIQEVTWSYSLSFDLWHDFSFDKFSHNWVHIKTTYDILIEYQGIDLDQCSNRVIIYMISFVANISWIGSNYYQIWLPEYWVKFVRCMARYNFFGVMRVILSNINIPKLPNFTNWKIMARYYFLEVGVLNSHSHIKDIHVHIYPMRPKWCAMHYC